MSKNSPAVKDQPLISFVLLAYNQEAFIREAVQSALEQTYQPLEIILSDDFSKDDTFEIIKNMAASYSRRRCDCGCRGRRHFVTK